MTGCSEFLDRLERINHLLIVQLLHDVEKSTERTTSSLTVSGTNKRGCHITQIKRYIIVWEVLMLSAVFADIACKL